MHCLLEILLLLALFELQICSCKKNAEYYVGAVVEYEPIGTPWDSSPDELLQKNCNNFVNLMQEASLLGADIIVFPEYGLSTLGMPRDRKGARPYLQHVSKVSSAKRSENQTVIERLSCAASSSNIYVVVNLGEIDICLEEEINCADDGVHQYSSSVAIDRTGTIIAKYRKHTRFFEEQFDSSPEAEIIAFDTDFGGKFGLITSYDIVFYSPAVQLVAGGAQNIIFPTVWYDQLPFLAANQASAMWSAGAKVNLLTSNYHQPLEGQIGSGIFSSTQGALNFTSDPSAKGNRYERICNNGFCCSITFEIPEVATKGTEYKDSLLNYRLVARNGTRKIAEETHQFAWQVCGVLRCVNQTLDLDSCTDHAGEEEFLNLKSLEMMAGPFHTNQVMQPSLNTLDTKFNAIPYSIFEFNRFGESFVKKILSHNLVDRSLQTVAIIGRIYLKTEYSNLNLSSNEQIIYSEF